MKRLHLKIFGRVQGVYFRSSAQSKAHELGLSGWAKNLPDGTVETVAEGLGNWVFTRLLFFIVKPFSWYGKYLP